MAVGVCGNYTSELECASSLRLTRRLSLLKTSHPRSLQGFGMLLVNCGEYYPLLSSVVCVVTNTRALWSERSRLGLVGNAGTVLVSQSMRTGSCAGRFLKQGIACQPCVESSMHQVVSRSHERALIGAWDGHVGGCCTHKIRADRHQGAKLLRRDDQRNVNHRYVLILTEASCSSVGRR